MNLPKIICAFLISMSIEYAITESFVERKELVVLMQKVVIGSIDNRSIKDTFHEAGLIPILKGLTEYCASYLANENHLADAEALVVAARAFKTYQLNLVRQLFLILLTLVEGGSELPISQDMRRIARGDLAVGVNPERRFTDGNPFVPLLQSVAAALPQIEENTIYEFRVANEILPTEMDITEYLAQHSDAIFLPLCYSDIEGASRIDKNKGAFLPAAKQLLELAKWLRNHLIMAQNASLVYTAVLVTGQGWMQENKEILQKSLEAYEGLLVNINGEKGKFIRDLDGLQAFLRLRMFDLQFPQQHDIQEKINFCYRIIDDLQKQGISPLKPNGRIYLKAMQVLQLVDAALESRTNIIRSLPGKFRLAGIEVAYDSPVKSLPSSSLRTHGVFARPDVSVAAAADDGRDPIATIMNRIMTYARIKAHQYKFCLPELPSDVRLSGTAERFTFVNSERTLLNHDHVDLHTARARLFYNLLLIIQDSQKPTKDKLYNITINLLQVRADPAQLNLFKSSDKIHGISVVLDYIITTATEGLSKIEQKEASELARREAVRIADLELQTVTDHEMPVVAPAPADAVNVDVLPIQPLLHTVVESVPMAQSDLLKNFRRQEEALREAMSQGASLSKR